MPYSLHRIAGLPAVRIFVLLAAGVLLQWEFALTAGQARLLTFILLIPSAAVAVAARRRRSLSVLRDLLFAVLLLAVGVQRGAESLNMEDSPLLRLTDSREKVTITGVIVGSPRVADGRRRFQLRCIRVVAGRDTIRSEVVVMVSWRRNRYDAHDRLHAIAPGDTVEMLGRLRLPLPPRVPGGFDARQWLIGEHCLLFCSVSGGANLRRLAAAGGMGMDVMLHGIREAVRERLSLLYTQTQAGIMAGLLLGDRGGIDQDTMTQFRRSGIMHILAVSGLHAGIILLLVFLPTERLPYSARVPLALAGLWLFAAVTGFAAPVTRAALMATLALSAVLLQRRGDTINALAAAGVIIILIDPVALQTVSFQLSFTAVLGILLFHRRVSAFLLNILPRRLRKRESMRTVANLLALTISAQSLSLPVLLQSFGEVSPVGLLTNLAAVPLVFVVVTCGVLSVLIFPLRPGIASMIAASGGFCLDAILLLSSFLATLPYASLPVSDLPRGAIVAYLAALLYLAWRGGRLRQKTVILLFAGGAMLFAAGALTGEPDGLLRVTFLDVGQGDATVLELPDGRVLLIDTGPGGEGSDAGSRSILPYLRFRGITRLDALVITHPDEDHRGGTASVIDQLPVSHVYLGGRWPDEGEAGELFVRMQASAGSVCDIRAGDRIDLGQDLRLYVLSPPEGDGIDASNEHSVVLLLCHGTVRVLLTGDAGAEAEQRLLGRYRPLLRADILKVGHHGSTTSTSPAFAQAVAPAHAVISAGRANRFGHPRTEVLERLRLLGAAISRTDVEGSVSFVSDGSSVRKCAPGEW